MAPTFTLSVSPPAGGSYPAATAYGTPTHPSYQTYASAPTPPDGTNGTLPNRGFGDAPYYMLATDDNGEVIFEPGPDAQIIYMTASGAGATPASIQAAEGLGFPADEFWVANDARWGRSEADALDFASYGWDVWRQIMLANPNSGAWILFERGYDYAGAAPNEAGFNGPSPLHPVVIGAWGTGTKPNMTSRFSWAQNIGDATHRENIAFSDLNVIPISIVMQHPKNLFFNRLEIVGSFDLSGSGVSVDMTIAVNQPQLPEYRPEGLTFYKTKFNKVSFLQPPPPETSWDGEIRGSGLFTNTCDRVLVYRCAFDENGWDRSYIELTADPYTYDPAGGHPPNNQNHNGYFQKDCGWLAVIETLCSRGAGTGFQMRAGGYMLNNVFVANNNDHQIFSGGSEGTSDTQYEGNWATYPVILGNVYTLGSIKAFRAGNLSRGFNEQAGGQNWVGIDMMVVNAADPLDAADVSAKSGIASFSLDNGYSHYRDVKIVNWLDHPDENAAGLDPADVQACTVGQYVDDQQSVAAGTNTTTQALDWIIAQNDPWDHTAGIQAWYAARLGNTLFNRATPEFISFQPHQVGDGLFWKTYTNWSSRDIPGVTVAEDSVNIAAWEVITWEDNCKLANFTMDAGGVLRVRAGKTRVTTLQGTGSIHVDGGGQFWCRGTSGAGVRSFFIGSGSLGCGRLGFESGTSSGVNITLTENRFAPELLICSGATVSIDAGRTLTIDGADLRAGFDGIDGGTATLTVAGTLALIAVGGAIGSIGEFRSGFFGVAAGGQPNATNVNSVVVLEAGSTVNVDTTGLAPGTYTLIEADSLTDNGATLPAGVAVNGNRLEVTV